MDLAHIPVFLPSRAQFVQYSKYKQFAHNQFVSSHARHGAILESVCFSYSLPKERT